MSLEGTGTPVAIQDQNFADTPQGWAQRWRMEFDAARKVHKEWQDEGSHIVDRFLDKRGGKAQMTAGIETRLAVFTSGVQTKEAALYGKVPQVDVRSKYSDAPDGVARVAGELLERLLNADVEDPTDGYRDALRNCLRDRLVPGVGMMRFRYVSEHEEAPDDEGALEDDDGNPITEQRLVHEDVETDYVHWRDVLWSPCRTFAEMRWCGFRIQLNKRDIKEKFGEEVAGKIALNAAKENGDNDSKKADPWQRADIWEIWDKEHSCVWFFCESYETVLRPVDLLDAEGQPGEQMNPNGSQKDPLGLDGFWPFQEPFIANLTTSAFLPRADYTIHKDLLDEIDRVATRITEINRAIGPKGVYDKSEPALARLLTESTNGQLLPVENFAKLKEGGGLAGAFEMLPLDMLTSAENELKAHLEFLQNAYMQVSGDSDLSRGQQMENGTPGEAAVKARFQSIRLQALKDEFARFASDGQRIRAEIIAKHFDPQTIIERSNIMHSFDAPAQQQPGMPPNPQALQQQAQLQQAVELVKSDVSCYRIEVKPEALSLADFDQQKSERAEVLEALGTFSQSIMPLVQMMPTALPFLLRMGQWMVSGLPGAASIEGVFDQGIAAVEQAQAQAAANPQPQQPDPKLLAAQAKAQGDVQKIQAEHQAQMEQAAFETQQLAQRKLTDAQVNVKEEAAKLTLKAHLTPAPIAPGGAA